MSTLAPLILIHSLSLISPGPDVFYVLSSASVSPIKGLFAAIGIFLGNAILIGLVLLLGSQVMSLSPAFFY